MSLTATSAQAAKVLIGACIYNFNDTFMTNVRLNMEDAAVALGAEIEIEDAESSQHKQNKQIDDFIAKGVNALIINCVDPTVADAIVDKAKAANLPVVFINTEPEPKILAKWEKAYYVGARAEESGVISGQLIAEYFKMHPEADKNGDGKLQYVLIKGEMGHKDVGLRSEYFIKAVHDTGLPTEEVASAYANWDRGQSHSKMKNFIDFIGLDGIEAVVANNDDMALGAVQALQLEGYNLGSDSKAPAKYIPVVGVDAAADALLAISKGQMLGTALNNAVGQGKAAVQLANRAATGREITRDSIIGFTVDDKYIWVPYVRITTLNCGDFL